MYSAKVIEHSIGPCKIPLLTMLLQYPRMVHPEFIRHRDFSYAVASSRAIPSRILRERIQQNSATIMWWGKNQRGMGADTELTGDELAAVQYAWKEGLEYCVALAAKLDELGLHKQLANRVLEPWMDVVQLTTGTSWTNFNTLRRHKDAQPEIREIAEQAYLVSAQSTPRQLLAGEWHLPFVSSDERENFSDDRLAKFSTARCARTSYLNHEGEISYTKDLELFARLIASNPGHWSPLEHVAQAKAEVSRRDRLIMYWMSRLMSKDSSNRIQNHGRDFLIQSGNLKGYTQFRKMFPNENIGGPRV